ILVAESVRRKEPVAQDHRREFIDRFFVETSRGPNGGGGANLFEVLHVRLLSVRRVSRCSIRARCWYRRQIGIPGSRAFQQRPPARLPPDAAPNSSRHVFRRRRSERNKTSYPTERSPD